MSNSELVRAFIAVVNRNQRDDIMAWFTPDSVFHNMPMEAATGLDAIWEVFSMVHDGAEQVDWQVHALAETPDGKVLTERTDRYRINGRWAEFPVMGIFELNDGKILRWRDYFDLAQCGAQLNE